MLEQISIPKEEDNSLNDVNCSSITISTSKVNSYVENLRNKQLNQVKLKVELKKDVNGKT
jgi:hypothetical protein